MRRLLFSLVMVFMGFASCTNLLHSRIKGARDASWHCPHRTITVKFDSKLPTAYRALGNSALLYFKHFGITIETTTGTPDVFIQAWNHNCNDHILGQHTTGMNYVLVDPHCTATERQYQVTVIHEVGHWLGMDHVCGEDGKTTDKCSPVGRGVAVLNPYIQPDHQITPTKLDIAEYDRVCWERD